MKYCWGIWAVLSLGIVAGCSGGTTTDDAGADAFPTFDAPATRDAIIGEDTFRDVGPQDANIHTEDAPLDAFTPNDTNAPGDANVDGGHDAAADGGNDASTSTMPDGGCATIDGQISDQARCDRAGDPPCPTGFTCQAMGGFIPQSHCVILCAGIGDHCPCSSACVEHPPLEGAPAYSSCDQL